MKTELISILSKKAVKSSCRFKISAIAFDKKNRLLGSTCNKPRLSRKHGGVHAEMRLMARYKDLIHHIIIMRVGSPSKKKCTILPIKPCINCKKRADSLGIKIYSVTEA